MRRLIARPSDFAAKRFNEGCSGGIQLLLQTAGAIAVAASPWFRAVLVAAAATVVRVLHPCQIEILLPVWTFFLKRRGTIADLDPSNRFARAKSGILHVSDVFAFGNGAFTQGLVVDSLQ